MNGDRLKSWTAKESHTMWLQDLLPADIPNIRIMTYGYHADTVASFSDRLSLASEVLRTRQDLLVSISVSSNFVLNADQGRMV